MDWCQHRETKLWTRLEHAQSAIPLGRAPWYYSALPADIKHHPLIGNTARICALLISQSSLFSQNSPLRPILGNPQFARGLHDAVFQGLSDVGLHQASHFSSGGYWRSITELFHPTDQFRLNFLRSLQLCHFLKLPETNLSQHWRKSVLTPVCSRILFP